MNIQPTKIQANISRTIRAIEAEAWMDMLNAAPPSVRKQLGIETFRSDNACFLACRELLAVPFNRGFAIGPQWAANDKEMAEGLRWLDRNASKTWVIQVDEEGFKASSAALSRMGIIQKDSGWIKFFSKTVPRVVPNEPRIEIADGGHKATNFANVIKAGYGFPTATFEWFKALANRDRWTCYIAYIDEEPCSAGAAFVGSAGAWFGIDATLATARGKGLQSALIARRLRDVSDKGAVIAMAETGRPATVDSPLGTSFRNYQRAGFGVQHYSANFARDANVPRSATPVLMM
ncbi:GNAT family N-acetyltransferase [Rhizobium laguerreae]|uniref:GNAT family N-acetyltransferase n=1 Tax=Rhizobium laguerreae TaxID=1076926 RepID=UPI001C8FAE48|nr:GNAT family N-acetyltransferase [Rhizobium laguerreae]MBY3483389.1 hypothetical protein [Rhizobium laguerreae]